MKIGFTDYDEPIPQPTLEELLASLTAQQKIGILNSYAEKVSVSDVKIIYKIEVGIVEIFYNEITEIEILCTKIMRNELVEPELDENGNEVPIDIPTPINGNQLATLAHQYGNDAFSQGNVTLVVNKMIEYSKSDGTGDWAWYSTKIIE